MPQVLYVDGFPDDIKACNKLVGAYRKSEKSESGLPVYRLHSVDDDDQETTYVVRCWTLKKTKTEIDMASVTRRAYRDRSRLCVLCHQKENSS
eukprot:UN26380